MEPVVQSRAIPPEKQRLELDEALSGEGTRVYRILQSEISESTRRKFRHFRDTVDRLKREPK